MRKWEYNFWAENGADEPFSTWDGFQSSEFHEFDTALECSLLFVREDFGDGTEVRLTERDETGEVMLIYHNDKLQGKLYVTAFDGRGD